MTRLGEDRNRINAKDRYPAPRTGSLASADGADTAIARAASLPTIMSANCCGAVGAGRM
jgi:hypothetical protein